MSLIIKKIKSNDVNQYYGITKSERTKESIVWYSIAREDLTTSVILLNSDRIAHAVFFIQHSLILNIYISPL